MSLAKPWFWLPPSLAHNLSPSILNGLTCLSRGRPSTWSPLDWRGLHFPNRLGIAGGVDKDARNIEAWWRLGAGFLEVGTITPEAQSANPGTVVDRDVAREALWNKLGFPSAGVAAVKARLKNVQRPFAAPLWANIGKNRTTNLEDAPKDYERLLHELRGLVDGFVINISSPNTQGLRDLLKPENLRAFLVPLLKLKREPMLLKLSPDLSEAELDQALGTSLDLGIDGWILTNTTLSRPQGLNFPTEGGLSGQPLASLAKERLKQALKLLGPKRGDRLVVSVGGVMNAQDVMERLELGADLVQVYSALIFRGPYFLRQVARWRERN